MRKFATKKRFLKYCYNLFIFEKIFDIRFFTKFFHKFFRSKIKKVSTVSTKMSTKFSNPVTARVSRLVMRVQVPPPAEPKNPLKSRLLSDFKGFFIVKNVNVFMRFVGYSDIRVSTEMSTETLANSIKIVHYSKKVSTKKGASFPAPMKYLVVFDIHKLPYQVAFLFGLGITHHAFKFICTAISSLIGITTVRIV